MQIKTGRKRFVHKEKTKNLVVVQYQLILWIKTIENFRKGKIDNVPRNGTRTWKYAESSEGINKNRLFYACLREKMLTSFLFFTIHIENIIYLSNLFDFFTQLYLRTVAVKQL